MVKLLWIWAATLIAYASSGSRDDECVIFDLENNIENLFSNDLYCASGYDSWEHGAYDALDISLETRGSMFMRPTTRGSCGRTTQLFNMSSNSIVEVNCYLETRDAGQAYLLIMLSDIHGQVYADNFLDQTRYPNGWHKLTIQLHTKVSNAYIMLESAVRSGSILLVDSFRYFNVNLNKTCDMYEVDSHEDVTDPSESSEEKENPDAGGDGDGQNCITFNLENEFSNEFVSDRQCKGLTPWIQGAYDHLDIRLDTNGTKYIRPTAAGSCSRTAEVIRVNRGGIIEINSYLELADGEAGAAYMHVLVQRKSGGFLGASYVNSVRSDNGWHSVYVDIYDNADDAHIVLMGGAPDGSNMWVDSIRYVADKRLLKTCDIYPVVIDSGESTTTAQPNISEEDPTDPDEGTDPDEETDKDGGSPFTCINKCICNCKCNKKDNSPL